MKILMLPVIKFLLGRKLQPHGTTATAEYNFEDIRTDIQVWNDLKGGIKIS